MLFLELGNVLGRQSMKANIIIRWRASCSRCERIQQLRSRLLAMYKLLLMAGNGKLDLFWITCSTKNQNTGKAVFPIWRIWEPTLLQTNQPVDNYSWHSATSEEWGMHTIALSVCSPLRYSTVFELKRANRRKKLRSLYTLPEAISYKHRLETWSDRGQSTRSFWALWSSIHCSNSFPCFFLILLEHNMISLPTRPWGLASRDAAAGNSVLVSFVGCLTM